MIFILLFLAVPKNKSASNIYDRIFRENAKNAFIALIQELYQLNIKSFQVLDPKFPSTSENEVDYLYEVVLTDGNKQILHIEFQSTNDTNMLARMQEYHAKIFKKYKLPIKPIVVNLSKKPFAAASKLKADEVFYGYDTIELFNLDTNRLLSSQIPEVVILAILSNYPKKKLETVLRAIVIKLKQLVIAEKDMNRFVKQLFYLSRLRKFEKETKEKLEDMLIEIDMEKDYYYQEGIEKGIEKGRKQGFSLGAEIIVRYKKGNSAETIAQNLNINLKEVQEVIDFFNKA